MLRNFYHTFILCLYPDAAKSQCSSMSDGESFEGFGESDPPDGVTNGGGTGHNVHGGGIDLELAPHLGSTLIG